VQGARLRRRTRHLVDCPQTLVQEHLARTDTPPGAAGVEELPRFAQAARASPPRGRQSPSRRIVGEDTRAGELLHGRYRPIERLGAGGFGVVWRAYDELLHREVALKRIPLPPGPIAARELDGEPRAGERASREALASARLSHPAIVSLHEAYVDEDAFYLVSELVDGCTLAQLVAQDALTDEQLLEIGVTLAHALAHAHARGVIHRDVKPHNVLVPRDPGAHETPAKLTDFGGASLVGEDALTRTGETLGTLAYMAPEQSEGLEVDELADVYSLALVVYEGLAGVNPVRGPTPAATARRVGRPLPSLAARRPDLPRALTDALDTALAIDPTQRGTLADLQAALELALARGPTRRRGLLGRRAARSSRESSGFAPPVSPATPHAPIAAEHHTLERHRMLVAGVPGHRQDTRARPASEDPASTADADSGIHGTLRLPLPRAVWAGCVIAVAVWQLASARPGVALLALAAAAPLLLAGPRPGIGWLTAGLAPVLGLVGLAGAYPALAGQASRWSRRAGLGALGYWWLVLSEPLLGGGPTAARLWLGSPNATPPRAVWEASLDGAATHVVGPTLTIGLLFGALLWAAAAVALPLIVRGFSAILDTLAAVLWSTALLAATPYFDAGLSAGATLPQPRGAVLGAIAGAAIAIAGRALRGPVGPRHP
jgi:eukaryotic-like serine/threonine-protein kinase